MTVREPLSPPAAKKLIRTILSEGTVSFTKHAREEMAKDKLEEIDIVNVLRGGNVAQGEWENGSWRYQVRTLLMVAVIAFRSEEMLIVVTAWRTR